MKKFIVFVLVLLCASFVAGRFSVTTPRSAAQWQYDYEKERQKIKEDNMYQSHGPAGSIHIHAPTK